MTTHAGWPYWLSVSGTVVSYILYPILFVLKILWYIFLWLSSPLVYIGRVSLIPWRIFARFEVCLLDIRNVVHELIAYVRRHSGTSLVARPCLVFFSASSCISQCAPSLWS